MSNFFPAAAWPPGLKFSSTAGSLLLAVLMVVIYRSIPPVPGVVHYLVWTLALLLLLVPVLCALLIVKGYEFDGDTLVVHRLIWKTRITLGGLNHVDTDARLFEGARRIIGNAGLYAFTGWHLSTSLGRFRLFATDLGRPVILMATSRTVVLTPESPQALVEYVQQRIAGTV